MLKYSVLIFVEKIHIKCNIWRVAVRPSYILGAWFLKVKIDSCIIRLRRTGRVSDVNLVTFRPEMAKWRVHAGGKAES